MKSTPVSEPALTIGQLADRFGLPTHVLRHWEDEGLITPAERVNGRRRYDRSHVMRVAIIVHGKEAGMSLKQLRDLLAAQEPTDRKVILEQHRDELERRIAQIEASKAIIEHALLCPIADMTHCPTFQELMEQVDARLHSAGDPACLTGDRQTPAPAQA